MINYYEELNLDRSKSLSEINTELTKQEGVWKRREITNPEKATKMLAMIIEAKKVFSSETARSKYDNDLEKSAREDSPLSAAEQREISLKKWVEQARMHFGDGSSDLAKAAIEKALGYIDNDNEDIDIYTLASDIYRECKEYDMAMNYINKAIILVPKDAYLYLIKAVIYFDQAEKPGSDYYKCAEEGKKTLDIALSKAEASNDNDMKATVIGTMAFLYDNMRPGDKKKLPNLHMNL